MFHLGLAFAMNLLLLYHYDNFALVSGNHRREILEHLLVGCLAAIGLVSAYHLIRYGVGREKIIGIVLIVLPSLFLLIALLWAAMLY